MARLVIVSNRVPDPTERASPRAGGLVVGLAEALVPGTLWFGWSGRRAETTTTIPKVTETADLTYATIDLGETDYRAFYLGFANSTLWPLFHMMPSLAVFDRADYAIYRRVNDVFAEALLALLHPDDLIWVHDYQLIGVAAALRARGVSNRIGFFLHIPFPAPAVLDILPPATELLDAFLAHDVIGVQTARDRTLFADAVYAAFGHRVGPNHRITHQGHSTQIVVAPVGIDAQAFNAMAVRAAQRVETRRMIDSLAGRALMIGVDRLDYTKGLPARFDAYERFLGRYAEHRRKLSFLQIAAPSREEVERYRALREELDHKTGSINGAFSDFDWVPLRYMTRTVGRTLIAGFYRTARIGLVTPLRDGMNLVAKEYIAAQDPLDPGVLILSIFAGAAEGLPEALPVNPFDIDAVAEAIHAALVMPPDERTARHAALLARVKADSASAFCQTFVAALIGGTHPPLVPRATNGKNAA
jgi:trehalose 6-phosphate synthase